VAELCGQRVSQLVAQHVGVGQVDLSTGATRTTRGDG
jgi:hypothetical protein